jgi:hypothetical protein
MQYVETVHDISLIGKIAASTRIWAFPLGEPIQDLTIVLHSRGATTPLGNINWSVYYGGVFDGDPYDPSSTHSGGIIQHSDAIVGPIEVAGPIYRDPSLMPTNWRSTSYTSAGVPIRKGYGGFPIVLSVTNATLEYIHLTATFIFKSSAIQ